MSFSARPPSLDHLLRTLLTVVGISNLSRIQNVEYTQIVDGGGGGAGFTTENHDRLANCRHAVARPRGGRRAHVLKRVPPSRGYPERSKVPQIAALLGATPEDVHDIVHERSSVSLARGGNVPYAIELLPQVNGWIVAPNVIEPLEAISTTEPTVVSIESLNLNGKGPEEDSQVHLVVVCDDGMVCSSGGNLWGCLAVYENLPPVVWHLQLIKVKGGEIVHEEALDLTTKDVYFGTQDVERMSVTPRRAGASRKSTRPVSRCYSISQSVQRQQRDPGRRKRLQVFSR